MYFLVIEPCRKASMLQGFQKIRIKREIYVYKMQSALYRSNARYRERVGKLMQNQRRKRRGYPGEVILFNFYLGYSFERYAKAKGKAEKGW
jgi:hypothetical protein